MKSNIVLFRSITLIYSILILLNISSCVSMKTLDARADAFVNHWKGKSLENFVKSNPEIDPFQVVDLGMGRKRYIFRYREDPTAEEFTYAVLGGHPEAELIRFIYLFVNKSGIIYDATWQRKIVK